MRGTRLAVAAAGVVVLAGLLAPAAGARPVVSRPVHVVTTTQPFACTGDPSWVTLHTNETVTTTGTVQKVKGTVTVTNVGYPAFGVVGTGISVTAPVDGTVTTVTTPSVAVWFTYTGKMAVLSRTGVAYLVGSGTTQGAVFGGLSSYAGRVSDLCAGTL